MSNYDVPDGWHEDPAQVFEVAEWAADLGWFDVDYQRGSMRRLLAFFEKPWHYEDLKAAFDAHWALIDLGPDDDRYPPGAEPMSEDGALAVTDPDEPGETMLVERPDCRLCGHTATISHDGAVYCTADFTDFYKRMVAA